jgi:hypothetical protein
MIVDPHPNPQDEREAAGWKLLSELKEANTPSYPADFVRRWKERGFRIWKQHFNRMYPALYAAVSAWGQESSAQVMGKHVSARSTVPASSRTAPGKGSEEGRKSRGGLAISTNATYEEVPRLQNEVGRLTRRCSILERCIEQMLLVAADHDRVELLPAMEKAFQEAQRLEGGPGDRSNPLGSPSGVRLHLET